MSSDNNYQILIVDDVELMCHFLYSTLMTIERMVCRTATEFTTAESILNNSSINMAIIDIHLKATSGLDIAKRIRQGKYNCPHDIPILIFSGNTYKDDIDTCLAFDVHDILVKPFSSAALKERVLKNKNKKVNIKTTEYYLNLDTGEKSETGRKLINTVITKGTSETESKYKPHVKKVDSEEKVTLSERFIKWPTDASTGFYQLDRRLESTCILLNSLHWSKYNKGHLITATDINKVRLSVDNLKHVATRLKKRASSDRNDELWVSLFDRLERFLESPLEELTHKNLNKEQLEEVFRRIHNSWMSILSKPILRRVEGEKSS